MNTMPQTLEQVVAYVEALSPSERSNIIFMSDWDEDKLRGLIAKAREVKNTGGEVFASVALILKKLQGIVK